MRTTVLITTLINQEPAQPVPRMVSEVRRR